MRHRTILAAAVAAATTLGLAVPATAEPATDDVATQLMQWSGDQLTAQERSGLTAQRSDRVQTYLQDEARQGRLHDLLSVREVTVTGDDGVDYTLVYDAGSRPEDLAVAVSTIGNGEPGAQAEIASVFSETDAASPSIAGGFGYGAGFNPSGMYKYTGGCRTVYFEPLYTHKSDHWTTTCYEKWAQSGTANWIYNRWGWFTRGTPSARYAYVIDYEIRSRPWKGYESRVAKFFDHTPKPSSSTSCDNTTNWSLKIGFVGISIPGHRCNGTFVVFPEANRKSGGVDWGGAKLGQVYLDFGISIAASNSSVVPVYADYSYAVVCDANSAWTCGTNTRTQALKLADSGW